MCRQQQDVTVTNSIMLIACISYDNCWITKAPANAEQLERLQGFLLYKVGGRDLTDTHKTNTSKATVLDVSASESSVCF